MIEVRPATENDFSRMFEIFSMVVSTGDSYVFSPDAGRDEARGYWLSSSFKTFVATDENRVVGMYKLRANNIGLGAHVANASFMVDSTARGKGIGRIMGEHCLAEARQAGFKSIQFNFVVSTNLTAIKLWKKLGFEIVGTLPRAFNHAKLGFVDAYVMYRTLET